ncbi:hypothetical protein TrRE_jg10776 [Triparma retinervis]|uniref:phosphatidate cytidylyltransferase n=1 Tax=Triparma retinervis TaxID=2557542 RepID=A0A9W7DPV9_9STRA|nr:hypothetical protein TrRE_jg10776 [Triparma retinervis]
MSGSAVKKDESKRSKILTRVWYGALMVIGFLAVMYAGHFYVCLLVALLEVLLFRELVKVRYNTYINTIEETIPLFRTTQWMWFAVAIFYTYGDFVNSVMQNSEDLHSTVVAYKSGPIHVLFSFGLYSTTFVLTVVTLQRDYIKFQLNQLCWTLCVLCLTVGQLKYIMHNIFNGFFWFVFPVLLVVINDVMAYVCGMSCGRKFISRPFLKLSPNKTWEGFIGGGIFTIIFGWYLAEFLSGYTWMTCPVSIPTLWSPVLECEEDSIFKEAISTLPEQLFDLIPNQLVRFIPGVIEFCENGGTIAPCISGTPHYHHHFELQAKVLPIQLHAITLALFASVVAPFGGFMASGIKRAYNIKDFDSIIPGHGGVMDRMDCQFLMALCTWVHYNAFVKMATVSVGKLLYLFKMLPQGEQDEFLSKAAEYIK